MRDYADELAMLAALGNTLGRFSALVSFNGRSFDWPLLETRFLLSRQTLPLTDPAHLDLLHFARRIWRVRLSSCSLSSLEENVLGVSRDNEDVPGWMVPQMYFQYLQDRDARPLSGVFYHNAQDILSLVTLAAYLADIGRDPFNGPLLHGEDFYCLGRLFENSGDYQGAIRAYEQALDAPIDEQSRLESIEKLSFLHKRLDNWPEAVQLWEEMLNAGELYPYVELAKYYEHRTKEYRTARDLVQDALSMTREARYADKWRKERDLAELEHRLQRLERKIKRSEK
jgi:hypothetical protein